MQGLGELCPSRSSLFLLTSLSCLGSVDLHAKRCNFERGPHYRKRAVATPTKSPLVFDPDAAERCQLVTVKPQSNVYRKNAGTRVCQNQRKADASPMEFSALTPCPADRTNGKKAFPKQSQRLTKAGRAPRRTPDLRKTMKKAAVPYHRSRSPR